MPEFGSYGFTASDLMDGRIEGFSSPPPLDSHHDLEGFLRHPELPDHGAHGLHVEIGAAASGST